MRYVAKIGGIPVMAMAILTCGISAAVVAADIEWTWSDSQTVRTADAESTASLAAAFASRRPEAVAAATTLVAFDSRTGCSEEKGVNGFTTARPGTMMVIR